MILKKDLTNMGKIMPSGANSINISILFQPNIIVVV
jgi:hypothetical protein